MAQQLAEVEPRVERRRISYEEWARWSEEGVRSEWVAGEVVVFMPATPVHLRAIGLFYALLLWYIGKVPMGEVFLFGLHVKFPIAAREPDVLFIARDNPARIEGARLFGIPDLVVEVISDDSVKRDTKEKFAEYEAAGIPEYWLFDPRPSQQWAKLYVLEEHGHYTELLPDEHGRLRSRVVRGFWLDPSWLGQAPSPPLHVLLDMLAPD